MNQARRQVRRDALRVERTTDTGSIYQTWTVSHGETDDLHGSVTASSISTIQPSVDYNVGRNLDFESVYPGLNATEPFELEIDWLAKLSEKAVLDDEARDRISNDMARQLFREILKLSKTSKPSLVQIRYGVEYSEGELYEDLEIWFYLADKETRAAAKQKGHECLERLRASFGDSIDPGLVIA